MNKRRLALQITSALMVLPGIVLAQGTTGSGGFGGTVPETYSITNSSNGNLSAALGTFSTLTIGKGTMATPTVLQVQLRSNHVYKLTANAAVTSGITDGAATATGNTAGAITTGDIGVGFTAALDASGASVVNGGITPTRTDTIVTGFDATAGWPSITNGHTPSFTKTLHSIYGSDIQILSGDRISASGDDSSSDNFLLLTMGIAAVPQYWSPSVGFSGTVTLTIATQ
jgi:hypothetical protein